MKRQLKYTVLLLSTLFAFSALPACVSFQVKDTQDGIVLAKRTLEGVNNTIKNLTSTSRVSVDTAKKLSAAADEVEGSLKLSSTLLSQGKPQDALGALRLANQLLADLQTKLEAAQ